MEDCTNIIFYANNLKDSPLGARMTFPDDVKNNRGLVNVTGDNNLCFFNVWRCIKAVIDGGMNVMLRNYSAIIECILKLRIMLSLVLIYPIL